MLETGLGLDYKQHIEEVERFGQFFGEYSADQMQPIHVRMKTAEECREILRRAKNLSLQPDFRRIYIQPYLTPPQLEQILQELRLKLSEIQCEGYPNAEIAFWKIVQYDDYGELKVLYRPTPDVFTAADEASRDQTVNGEEEYEHDKDNDSVTSDKEQDDVSCLEDRDRCIDPALDYQHMLNIYNVNNTNDNNRNEWDLVFHNVPEGMGGRTDRQLIEWVLETGLGLDYSQHIEEIERFGEYSSDQVQPIHVRMKTAEECREILRQAKNLSLRRDFRRMYIQPYLTRPQLDRILQELLLKLSKIQQHGYPNAEIAFWKIVQYDEDGELKVLYTPNVFTAADEASQNQIVRVEESADVNVPQTFDYEYMLKVYEYETYNSERKEWDLVLHRVREGLGGKKGARQLTEWVLKAGLGLDYSQRIEKAERFGKIRDRMRQIQPIRVKMSRVEDCREILLRAKHLRLRKDLGRLYIQPFLSLRRLDEIRKELEQKLSEYQRRGYRGATIAFWRIVQYDYNGEPIVLYTPQM